MSVRSAARRSLAVSSQGAQAQRPSADLVARRRRDARRRQLNVAGLRLVVAIVFLTLWEVTTRLGWVDTFFWSQPSAIVAKLWYWITQGTELGPLWGQAAGTLGEGVGGFVGGSLFGIVFGVGLGRHPV